MNLYKVIVLGLVQGLTEFIPVSSSGHLVLAQHFLGLPSNFTFDVLLNFGTLLALVLFYRQRIWAIISHAFKQKDFLLIGKLMVATIPTFIAGFLFNDFFEKLNSHIWIVVVMLSVVGLLMVMRGTELQRAKDTDESITWRTALLIGLVQVLALIPGTSRSGITILAALNLGIGSKKAAEFSFLLAIPTILGASMKTLLSSDGMSYVSHHLMYVTVGNLVSFISGMLAIRVLLNLLSKKGLKEFGYYRIGLALLLTVLLSAKIL